eukprot:CAMPEP_0194709766 /NCGR_PEP_ID=MMETSP0296-20130528/2493_1 /TAXON_ID=39354 /ORGANISM="Heterosigma akashiwo, Strain CCMP2393" /LENGTH=120 /DNA_ID=CAMNT_0039607193 /DNA_START=272 /DNA_END=632 /DNA_ORIENTATION=+
MIVILLIDSGNFDGSSISPTPFCSSPDSLFSSNRTCLPGAQFRPASPEPGTAAAALFQRSDERMPLVEDILYFNVRHSVVFNLNVHLVGGVDGVQGELVDLGGRLAPDDVQRQVVLLDAP